MGEQVNTPEAALERYDALANQIADELLEARAEIQRLRQVNEKLVEALASATESLGYPAQERRTI